MKLSTEKAQKYLGEQEHQFVVCKRCGCPVLNTLSAGHDDEHAKRDKLITDVEALKSK